MAAAVDFSTLQEYNTRRLFCHLCNDVSMLLPEILETKHSSLCISLIQHLAFRYIWYSLRSNQWKYKV
jgi:hypothetical protein